MNETAGNRKAGTPMDAPLELDLTELTADEYQSEISDAIDNAADQDRMTWLTGPEGKRIAVLAPVEVGEYYEQMIAGTLGPRQVRTAELTERIGRLRDRLRALDLDPQVFGIGGELGNLALWERLVALAEKGRETMGGPAAPLAPVPGAQSPDWAPFWAGKSGFADGE